MGMKAGLKCPSVWCAKQSGAKSSPIRIWKTFWTFHDLQFRARARVTTSNHVIGDNFNLVNIRINILIYITL